MGCSRYHQKNRIVSCSGRYIQRILRLNRKISYQQAWRPLASGNGILWKMKPCHRLFEIIVSNNRRKTLSVLEPEIFGMVLLWWIPTQSAHCVPHTLLNGGSDGLFPFGGHQIDTALQMFCFNVQSFWPERFKGICAFGGYGSSSVTLSCTCWDYVPN